MNSVISVIPKELMSFNYMKDAKYVINRFKWINDR